MRARALPGSAVAGLLVVAVLTAALAAAALAALMALTALNGGSDSPSVPPGSKEHTVGWAQVAYPRGWTVLTADQRPQGWDWAAQTPDPTPAAGASPGPQIAVDGDFSRLRDVQMSAAGLLAGAQVGGLPNFAVVDQGPVDVHGAQEAVRIRFTYRTNGTEYEGVWLVARAKDTRTVAVQVTGRRPLSDQLSDQTLAGLGLTAHDENAPPAVRSKEIS
jgi:hypothetical protein